MSCLLVSSPEIASAFADIADELAAMFSVFLFTAFFTSESSALISVSSYNSSFADITPSGLMVMLSPAVSLFCLLVSRPAIASAFVAMSAAFLEISSVFALTDALSSVSS